MKVTGCVNHKAVQKFCPSCNRTSLGLLRLETDKVLELEASSLKAELKEILKRTVLNVRDHGGVVGPMENLGARRLPYRMKKAGVRHTEGFYALMEVDLPASQATSLVQAFHRDKDVIRPTLVRQEVEAERPCSKGECFFGELNDTEVKLVRKWGTFNKLPA